MGLYTFILEYRGGTYISQLEAPNPAPALETWLETHDHTVVWKLEGQHINAIKQQYAANGFTSLSGVGNVWCFTFHVGNHLGLLNFVLTSRD